jgi:hypothetical protein
MDPQHVPDLIETLKVSVQRIDSRNKYAKDLYEVIKTLLNNQKVNQAVQTD